MGDLLLLGTIFVPLAAFSLYDILRRREYRYLWTMIPLYAAALALDLVIASGVPYVSITVLLENLLSRIVK